jgi:hypothetical protein
LKLFGKILEQFEKGSVTAQICLIELSSEVIEMCKLEIYSDGNLFSSSFSSALEKGFDDTERERDSWKYSRLFVTFTLKINDARALSGAA